MDSKTIATNEAWERRRFLAGLRFAGESGKTACPPTELHARPGPNPVLTRGW